MSLKEQFLRAIETHGRSTVAEATGVSATTVANWDNGKRAIGLEYYEMLVEKGLIEPSLAKYPAPVSNPPDVFDSSAPKPPGDLSWEGRNLVVLMPCYRQTNPWTMFAVFNFLDRHNGKVGFRTLQNTMVHKARNRLLTEFRDKDTDAEWALFVDDDVVPPFGNAGVLNGRLRASIPAQFAEIDGISRLVSRKKDLIGGVYMGKIPGAPAMYAEASGTKGLDVATKENSRVRQGPRDEIKATDWLGMGFTLIHRRVLEAIEKSDPSVLSKGDRHGYGYCTPIPKVAESDDTSFCYRARQAGIQPHVDHSVVCGHHGQHIYWPSNT
jgi:hypothetical protein